MSVVQATKNKSALPVEFLRWVAELRCQNPNEPVPLIVAKVIRRWKDGHPIPGYETTPPADGETGAPKGWNARTLWRATQPMVGKQPAFLPEAFVKFWLRIVEKYNSASAAHRELLRYLDAWQAGNETAAIPGYETPPVCDRHCGRALRKVPRGWGYRNLMRYKARASREAVILRPKESDA